jgi:hypothetical protein
VQEITTLMATTKPAAASGGGQQLQAFQKDMLQKLRALRDSLDAERAPFAKMQVERDQAVAEKTKVRWTRGCAIRASARHAPLLFVLL